MEKKVVGVDREKYLKNYFFQNYTQFIQYEWEEISEPSAYICITRWLKAYISLGLPNETI